jgi:hypothetical protein
VSARDAGSGFPATPARATIVIAAEGAPSVALWRVPGAVLGGTTTDLEVDVRESAEPVVWSVDGVDGGNATVGTIDEAGRYRAPATVPAGGKVEVAARLATGERDAMGVTVLPPPVADASPSVPPDEDEDEELPADPVVAGSGSGSGSGAAASPLPEPPAPGGSPTATTPAPAPASPPRRRARVPVGTVRAVRTGPFIAVAVSPSAAGRLRISLLAGARRVGSCSLRARAGRQVVCRLRRATARRRLVITLRRPTGGSRRGA